MDTLLFKVDTFLIKVDTNLFNVDTNLFKVDTNLFKVGTNLFKVDTNLFKVDTNFYPLLRIQYGYKLDTNFTYATVVYVSGHLLLLQTGNSQHGIASCKK